MINNNLINTNNLGSLTINELYNYSEASNKKFKIVIYPKGTEITIYPYNKIQPLLVKKI